MQALACLFVWLRPARLLLSCWLCLHAPLPAAPNEAGVRPHSSISSKRPPSLRIPLARAGFDAVVLPCCYGVFQILFPFWGLITVNVNVWSPRNAAFTT